MSPRKILTVAAHPDDEILGCGGAMARFAEEGHEVRILILAEGATSRDVARNREAKKGELSRLASAARQAAESVGAASVELLDFPDNRMDGVELLEVVKQVEVRINDFEPDTLFTHFPFDLNIDHQIVADAVITACRPQPECCVGSIFFFEVPSATDYQVYPGTVGFQPDFFLSLSESQMRRKMEAIGHYADEMRGFPHSRSAKSVEALGRVRGAQCGKEWAEAFKVARIVR